MLVSKPLGTIGGVIVVAMLVAAVLADWIAPYGFAQTSLRERFIATSAAHWLGTDELGRDLLTRLIYGARISTVVLTEASLSFLGLGVPPPYPTWGGMLSLAGLDHMYRAPWLAIWPAVALSLAVFGFNMLGDALRDLLDPRLKGG